MFCPIATSQLPEFALVDDFKLSTDRFNYQQNCAVHFFTRLTLLKSSLTLLHAFIKLYRKLHEIDMKRNIPV